MVQLAVGIVFLGTEVVIQRQFGAGNVDTSLLGAADMMVECREDLEVASHPDREAWSLAVWYNEFVDIVT
jgi:hypothetical protein